MEPHQLYLEHRGYSLEPPLWATIDIFFSFYHISPTKNQNIEEILSDSEP